MQALLNLPSGLFDFSSWSHFDNFCLVQKHMMISRGMRAVSSAVFQRHPPSTHLPVSLSLKTGVFRLQGFVLELVTTQPGACLPFVSVVGSDDRIVMAAVRATYGVQMNHHNYAHCLYRLSHSAPTSYLLVYHSIFQGLRGKECGTSCCRLTVLTLRKSFSFLNTYKQLGILVLRDKAGGGENRFSLFLFQQAQVFVRYKLDF